jgi:hypothetical protein
MSADCADLYASLGHLESSFASISEDTSVLARALTCNPDEWKTNDPDTDHRCQATKHD